MVKGLWILIRERFPLGSYLPMVILFTLVNGLYSVKANSIPLSLNSNWSWALLIMISAFLRLRLFDEIKDYEVDLNVNPTRPLARGVLKIYQARLAIAALLVFELSVTASFGLEVLLVHLIAVSYSLLMFEEFFIGDFLRPHLTTYAVTHTFVSVLFGASCFTIISGHSPNLAETMILKFLLTNWAYFNLFEFARKTYARQEERKDVDTYSSLFGTGGAVGLSLSQALLGVYLTKSTPSLIALGIYILLCLYFVAQPVARNAKIFRAASGVYLLVQYILMAAMFGGQL